MMFNFVSKQSSSLAASYEVALLLANKMKPFREGKLAKACALKIVEAFGGKKWQKNSKRCLSPIRQWHGE